MMHYERVHHIIPEPDQSKSNRGSESLLIYNVINYYALPARERLQEIIFSQDIRIRMNGPVKKTQCWADLVKNRKIKNLLNFIAGITDSEFRITSITLKKIKILLQL